MSSPIRTRPTVIKIGGSLLGATDLDDMLHIAGRRGAIVVPGGGPFADAVREAQKAFGFSDAIAHRMAIRAMEQTADLFLGRSRELEPCRTMNELRSSSDGKGGVWLPTSIALSADLPASWEVTSDSLALWLAIALDAQRLILLKAATVPQGSSNEWTGTGLADAFFPRLADRFSGEIVCVGPASAPALEAALAAPGRLAA